MDSAISIASFGICIYVALIAIVKVVNWVWLRPKRIERCLREQGLKGNSYKLLFGDSIEMIRMMNEAKSKPMNLSDDIVQRVLPYHDLTIRNYGKNSFIWMGPTPMVNITNPEDIKDVFNKMFDFQKPENSPLVKYMICGLVEYEGKKWIKQRKLINPAFHMEKLKLMLPAFYQCCNDMINQWKTLVCRKGSCEIDVWPFLHNLAGDVISRTAFGSSYGEGKRIFELQEEQAVLTTKLLQSVYIPGWRFLPTKMNKRIKKIDQESRLLLRGIIHKREKAMKGGEAPNDDLLGILLESNYREIQENENKKEVGMSIDEVIDECKLFYLAGQDTTSVMLNWTMMLLSKYPNWQANAREEVIKVFGTNKPDYDGLSRLKVVTMIFNEALRLYPPAALLTRAVKKETKLGNTTLPAGTRIWLPELLVHHNRELWGDDAKEFKPERFSEGVSKATNGRVSFIPFGWGPRTCIGQNYAFLEGKMALSLILQNFSFELSPSYVHAPHMLLTLQPQFGTHLILHKL